MSTAAEPRHEEAADAQQRRSPLPFFDAPDARRLLLFGASIILPFFLVARLFWIGAWSLDRKLDIYFHFSEGVRISQGINPYERIREGDMLRNKKYATLLPPTYLLFALFAKAGCSEYVDFLLYWNALLHLSHFAIGCLILWRLSRHSWFLATFGFWFWLFNRWSILCLFGSYLESFVLIFPVIAVMLAPKRFRTACLLFGLGLGFKHIAIFAAPLFLIWGWQRGGLREAVVAGVLLALPAAITSIPFLVLDPGAFIRSILFSGTRRGDELFWVPVQPFDGPTGQLLRRLPIAGLCLLVYAAAWRRQILPFGAVFLSLSAFVLFNLILFTQYNLWMIAFLPFAIAEQVERRPAANP